MKEPIRILHVVSSMNLGGIQSLIMNLYRNIDRNKVQFDFVVHTPEQCVYNKEILKMGGKIYCVPRFTFQSFFTYITLWETFFNKHPEYQIVHGHIRSTASIYLGVAKKHGRFTIAHSHSTYVERGAVGFIKRVLEYPLRFIPDDWFSCSKEAALVLFGPKKALKTKILKNAIDVNKFRYSSEKRVSIRKELGIEDKFVCGTVGRIEAPKNPYFIVDIIKECSLISKDFYFLWVGDGQLIDQVKAYATKLRCNQNISFLGATQDVPYYLSAMDSFILPSLDEGFGIAAIEAETIGLPVFVSDHVPQEVCIADNCSMIPLKDNAKIWASKILTNNNLLNENNYCLIMKKGYDIREQAGAIQSYYQKKNNAQLMKKKEAK